MIFRFVSVIVRLQVWFLFWFDWYDNLLIGICCLSGMSSVLFDELIWSTEDIVNEARRFNVGFTVALFWSFCIFSNIVSVDKLVSGWPLLIRSMDIYSAGEGEFVSFLCLTVMLLPIYLCLFFCRLMICARWLCNRSTLYDCLWKKFGIMFRYH